MRTGGSFRSRDKGCNESPMKRQVIDLMAKIHPDAGSGLHQQTLRQIRVYPKSSIRYNTEVFRARYPSGGGHSVASAIEEFMYG
jgi:hypothetical protein